MRLIFIISLFSLLTPQMTWATAPGLEAAYDRLLSRATDGLINIKSRFSKGAPNTCHEQAFEIRADREITIAVAFGYMDISSGQDFVDTGSSLYGRGSVLDGAAKTALKTTLMLRCPGAQKLAACGFSARGDRLTKTIKDRWTKKRVKVTIELVAPSISGDNSHNISGQKQARQERSSNNAKNFFLSALQTADVVLYLGHARSGGGPDFYPPILKSNGNVNYPLYKKQKKGLNAMLSALNQAAEPASLVGLLSCKSTGLFSRSVRRKAPESLVITAGQLFDYSDILPTGLAIIEGVVGQNCSKEFTQLVKVQPNSRRFLDLFY